MSFGVVASSWVADTSEPTGITHGEQLTINSVGPWSLQNVANGTESLQAMTTPGRGYWRMDTPNEFSSTGTYVYNDDPPIMVVSCPQAA